MAEFTKGKYNYTKRIEQNFPCGCHIDEMIDGSYGITYCPKHKVAPDMALLLLESREFIGGDWRERRDKILKKAGLLN